MRHADWYNVELGEDDVGYTTDDIARVRCCGCRSQLGEVHAHPAPGRGSSSTLTLAPGLVLRAGPHAETGYPRFGLPRDGIRSKAQAFTRAPAVYVYCPDCGLGQVVAHRDMVEAVDWSMEPDSDDLGD